MAKRQRELDQDAAETIAIAALAFLAEDGGRLGRFLALTGVGPETLRMHAHQPDTLAAVLQHLLADESLMLVFCAEAGISPEAIQPAHRLLSGTCGH